jgi:hypothetical protein
MPMDFFNQPHWAVSKLANNISIIKDTPFLFQVYIADTLKLTKPDNVDISMFKLSGRDRVELPDVVTVSKITNNVYSIAGMIPSTLWSGSESLVLQVVINDTSFIILPMVGNV